MSVLDDGRLKVEGANWVVLHMVASSSFEGPFTKPSESEKDPASVSLSALKSIKNQSYSELYSRHLDDYQNLFHRVSLQLCKGSDRNIGDRSLEIKNLMPSGKRCVEGNKDVVPTVDRIRSFQSDEDPSLVELLFQFGRYLLISSSRPGTQVANLQGIWNKDLEPKWEYVTLSDLLHFPLPSFLNLYMC
jgi:alpha-L-fucosidase 2